MGMTNLMRTAALKEKARDYIAGQPGDRGRRAPDSVPPPYAKLRSRFW